MKIVNVTKFITWSETKSYVMTMMLGCIPTFWFFSQMMRCESWDQKRRNSVNQLRCPKSHMWCHVDVIWHHMCRVDGVYAVGVVSDDSGQLSRCVSGLWAIWACFWWFVCKHYNKIQKSSTTLGLKFWSQNETVRKHFARGVQQILAGYRKFEIRSICRTCACLLLMCFARNTANTTSRIATQSSNK